MENLEFTKVKRSKTFDTGPYSYSGPNLNTSTNKLQTTGYVRTL